MARGCTLLNRDPEHSILTERDLLVHALLQRICCHAFVCISLALWGRIMRKHATSKQIGLAIQNLSHLERIGRSVDLRGMLLPCGSRVAKLSSGSLHGPEVPLTFGSIQTINI